MEDETTSYKEEFLRLVAEKKIKHTAKYIEKATDETLKKFTTATKDKNEMKSTNKRLECLSVNYRNLCTIWN